MNKKIIARCTPFNKKMVMIKVFIDGMPIDYEYGARGTHDDSTIGIAQRHVNVLPNQIKAGLVAAYSLLWEEYCSLDDTNINLIPEPGKWCENIYIYPGTEGMGVPDGTWEEIEKLANPLRK